LSLISYTDVIAHIKVCKLLQAMSFNVTLCQRLSGSTHSFKKSSTPKWTSAGFVSSARQNGRELKRP